MTHLEVERGEEKIGHGKGEMADGQSVGNNCSMLLLEPQDPSYPSPTSGYSWSFSVFSSLLRV
jgi:hypothetical protein